MGAKGCRNVKIMFVTESLSPVSCILIHFDPILLILPLMFYIFQLREIEKKKCYTWQMFIKEYFATNSLRLQIECGDLFNCCFYIQSLWHTGNLLLNL